jgi:hypothetical protein
MTNDISMTWDEWVSEFRPILNVMEPDGFDGEKYYLFQPDGEQYEFVKTFVDQDRVWTYLDLDRGAGIYNVFKQEDAIGYYITEESFDKDAFYEVDFEEVESREEPNE